MGRLLYRLPAVIVLLLTTAIAFGLGILLILLISFMEAQGKWERLDSPPGKIIHLITADEDHVVVETEAGRIFEVQCRTRDQDYPCVEEVVAAPSFDPLPCDIEDIPTPTGEVVQRMMSCFEYEYRIRSQYVLRPDGSLWRWRLEIYPYGQVVRAFQILAASIILGLATGVMILRFRSR